MTGSRFLLPEVIQRVIKDTGLWRGLPKYRHRPNMGGGTAVIHFDLWLCRSEVFPDAMCGLGFVYQWTDRTRNARGRARVVDIIMKPGIKEVAKRSEANCETNTLEVESSEAVSLLGGPNISAVHFSVSYSAK